MRIFLLFLLIGDAWAFGPIDCSEAYGERAHCMQVECSEEYQTFLGTWAGPFVELVENPNARAPSSENEAIWAQRVAFYNETQSLWPGLSSYQHLARPYTNQVSYSEQDCLRNVENGDVFIIGRKTDRFPEFQNLSAETRRGLLITGRHRDGSPFLKTIDSDRHVEYELVSKNPEKSLSIWKKDFPWGMTISVIDGRVPRKDGVHKRSVTLLLETDTFKGPIAYGHHTRSEP